MTTQFITERQRRLGDEATVAELIQASRRTVRRYSEAGILPRPILIGNLRRWDLDAVEAAINRLQPVSEPARPEYDGTAVGGNA